MIIGLVFLLKIANLDKKLAYKESKMNHLDKKVYAIRYLGFMYNDEYYSIIIPKDYKHDGHIQAFFEDKEVALQAWKNLEHQASHALDFENITGFEGSYYLLEQHGFDTSNIEEQLKLMNQDELFELIQTVDRHVFYMHEYSANLKVKVLFNLINSAYESCEATSDNDHISNIFLYINDDSGFLRVKGTLEELTDAPLLLNQLIEQDPNLEYDSPNNILKIKSDEKILNSVNALLKNPLYEIRYLTIQEIYEIEQTLNSSNNQVA